MKIYDDHNDMWDFFIKIIISCLDTYAPLKKVYSKYSQCHTPWLSPEILSTIREKQRAKRIAERSERGDNIDHYKHLKNNLKSTIHSAKLFLSGS